MNKHLSTKPAPSTVQEETHVEVELDRDALAAVRGGVSKLGKTVGAPILDDQCW